ncbi:uncharacterized protein LOC125316327 [Rhodamnia argentea]|uniref:Uncharacterized protein LOC125316327 n=1 Tax=Rhodamnia argentea TaxID=178133 RepID=A0ABM3HUQ7_9MYRT|nr:uncharacterized protein LOC125316327 [Rhodamnia argentea]
MDSQKSVEDQFSKLHPCLALDTRIGIVGGGPSGLSAAYALAKLGYRDITVIEKHNSVGGMCESVEIEGKVYDLGGQVLAANSAPVIFHLAKESGTELEEMDFHKQALIDSFTGEYHDINVAEDYMSLVSLTLEIQDKAKDSNRIGIHAVSDIASDLTPAYLEAHGLKSVPKSVQYGYTASGYGFVQDMPYAYIHEFTRTSMAGKIRRMKGGYMSLWKKISESLLIKVCCNTEVQAVRRNDLGVNVDITNSSGETEHKEFDKIIISGAFPFKNSRTYRSTPFSTEAEIGLLDVSDLERDLFSKVQTIDYYTTVLKIKGLERIPVGFYYLGEYMDDPSTIGHPVAMQRFYANTNIFLFWSYGDSVNIRGSNVIDLVIEVVKRMGGEVEKVILQRQFKYFPHVGSEAMKDGFYERLESELQGHRNTYYVGGLFAFELTERNSSYAMALICKHFASANSLPTLPYVKSLFTLQLDQDATSLKTLSETCGVAFPDLPTLDGYLKHWAAQEITQNKVLYTWIKEERAVVCQRTYGELDSNASCIAHSLLTSRRPTIKPGDRVLLVHVPGLDFVDAFFGCLRAKVIPIPVLPPDPLQRGGQALMKIENIAKLCNAVAILSTVGYHAAVRAGSVKNLISFTGKSAKSTAQWPSLPWLHTDSWIKSSKVLPAPNIGFQSGSQPDDLCFLQFTSGSTGDAKGVMITHSGLIHNVKLMRRRYRSTSNTVLVSWLPQYHDMGLIGGLFTAMVCGGSAILFSPLTFIRNPLLWLQTISDYKATHSAGPNFAFELVIRRLEADKAKAHDYDLSSVIFLMIAAEPVRQKTLKRFVELTSPFGLSQEVMAPGYGLAENCVFVSCAYGKKKPVLVDWQGRICCGYVDHDDADVDIRIVDADTGLEADEDGKEGEIWISSPSAGTGYWGKEKLSQKTFRNKLQKYPGRKYTRTGDLGRVIQGNLFITGRIKDLIIVAGRNIYSADVEKTVESSSELLRPGCCAVIGVPEDVLSAKGISLPDASDQVGLVVVAELRDGKPVDKDIVKQIESRVVEEHGVTVASVKLIRPRTMSKTTSGKIKRFECLKQFVDGTLNTVPDPIVTKRSLIRSFTTATCREGNTPRPHLAKGSLPPSPKLSNRDIVEFLKQLISEQTGIAIKNISATESLVSYGIDSIGVVRAAQKLSDFLGVPVGAVDIFTATCIADLANFAENLLMKSQPHLLTTQSNHPEPEILTADFSMEISRLHHWCIWSFQLLGLLYVTFILVFPAYVSVSIFQILVSASQKLIDGLPWLHYTSVVLLAPLSWILCIALTSVSIAFFGNLFLRINCALTPEVSVWSLDFVKWWALYKAQEVSSKVLAVHLRGTVFLKHWFEMLGARIGSSVLLDTVDITDPSLVSIGDGTVIAEGALLQSHEVQNSVLRFQPIRIGRNCSVGPYAVVQKGSVLGEGAEVPALQKSEGAKSALKMAGADKILKVSPGTLKETIQQFMGIYMVGFLSSLSAAAVYLLYMRLSQKVPSLEQLAFLCISGALHWVPFTIVAYATMFTNTPPNPFQFAIALAIAYFAHGLVQK